MGNDFLFTRIKQGDEKALEKFTKENYLFFCALANRYVNDVQEAEDIVQEVLIRLWENRRHYQDITCLRSFVYTMIPESVLKSDPESQTFKSTLSSPTRRRGKQFFQYSRRRRKQPSAFQCNKHFGTTKCDHHTTQSSRPEK